MDTPGFSHTDNQDEEIADMTDILANVLDHADTLVMVVKGSETRLTDGLLKMIDRMSIMFGRSWWDYLVFGVSFWSYSQQAIDGRACDPAFPEFCHDEHWYSREMTKQVKDIFGIERNLTFARY